MPVINRTSQIKELVPGINALFGDTYKAFPDKHTEIFEIEKSSHAFEEDVKLSGFTAAPVKNEGAAIVYDDSREAFTARYTHETIAMGFAITEEAMEDNLYEQVARRNTKLLARSMAYTKQIKAANILNNAFNSSFAGGDGVSLCSNAHPLVSGGVNSNVLTVAADLSETSLEAAVIQMYQWADERGLLIAAKPKKLVIPPSLQFVATRILQSEQRVDTPNNDINALKNNGAIPQGYSVNPWLTDDDAWFITTDIPNGLKHFIRAPLTQKMDGDFETGNCKYKARERYSFGWSDPLALFGSPGA